MINRFLYSRRDSEKIYNNRIISCPLCKKNMNENSYSVRNHFNQHKKAKEVTTEQIIELEGVIFPRRKLRIENLLKEELQKRC